MFADFFADYLKSLWNVDNKDIYDKTYLFFKPQKYPRKIQTMQFKMVHCCVKMVAFKRNAIVFKKQCLDGLTYYLYICDTYMNTCTY